MRVADKIALGHTDEEISIGYQYITDQIKRKGEFSLQNLYFVDIHYDLDDFAAC